MPKILESEALTIARSIDQAPETDRPWMLDLLDRYQQQQRDEGEPDWPSVERARVERETNLRSMFEAPDKIDYDPGPMSLNPELAKMQHANMALLSARYQKEPAEVASRYDFLLNDYARQKLGASEDVDTAKFYALAQKAMQKVKLREDTQREGMSAALRGEDGVKALAAWQAKNADRAKDDAGLFMRGYQQAIEQDGEMLPIADRLLKALESGTDKTGQNVQANMERGQVRQELGQMVEQLAGMKKAQRKSVYRSIAARIEAAGYDQKGFWSQMLGYLDQQLYRAETTLSETGGIASDVSSNFPAMLAEGMTGNRDFGMTAAETALTDANVARRKSIGNVQQEIMQIVSGELDPVKPVTGWMNETIETGLIKGPGAVAPFMAASALLGPYGAGVVFTADFAAQNRRELVQSGLDDEQAQKIAVMAAPLQAAVESLSNMVSLGKFPAVQAALSRFTRPVGGASLVGRYVQNSLISGATEFTEEQVQDNVVVPVMQELLGALEKDVPEVDWSFYKTRAANATPELAATLLPMALVFGGVMTAADARLSDRMTSNVDALTALNYSQAQATEIVQEKTPEARIAKAASLWRSRAGNKASLAEGAAKLAERLKALSGDAVAYQAELERRGVLPRVMHTAENDWLLTFNDGSTARFGTHDEASTARWTWAEDQLGRVHALTREALTSMERNMSTNRELGVEFKPDVRMVEAGQTTPDIQRRVEQGKVLGDIDPNEAFDTASMVDRATAEADGFLSSYQILGSSRNEFKDGVLRTTIKLWEGSNVLTLVEEKLEGDAKAIVASRGGRGWMLAALRNYEQESGDKLFREVPDNQLTEDDLVEAWSHLGQSYLVGRSSFGEPLQQNNMRRFSRLLMRAGLAGALNSESTFWQAVVNRAQKLGELKAAGKLNEDVVAELEKQLGIDSQVKHEQGAMQEAQNVANEVAQQVDTSGYSEANPGPNGETFSAQARAKSGGQIGPNGEWYPGGAFIATTQMPKKVKERLQKLAQDKPSGIEVAQRVFEPRKPGMFSPYARLAGVVMGPSGNLNEAYLSNAANRIAPEYNRQAREAVARWNAGERQLPINEFPLLIGANDAAAALAGGFAISGDIVEANPWLKEMVEGFNQLRAIPADASKVVQMPDGAPETFSLGKVTPAQDAEYMAAVEAGDMEKAQRMVDEAAKSAGYKSASVIHSTNAEFNSFGRVRWVSTIKGKSEVITPIKSTGIGLIYATQDSAYSALFGDKQLKLYHNISNPADLRSLGSRNVSDSAFDATLSTLGIAHKSSSMGAAPVFERLNKGQHKKAMLEAGFDGFALRERSGDLEADAIAGFDSSQFKSADPVTRDESGNVIPLSQRFNPADDRITYSLRVTPAQDAEYMAAVEAGDMEKAQRMVDEAMFENKPDRVKPESVSRIVDAIKTNPGDSLIIVGPKPENGEFRGYAAFRYKKQEDVFVGQSLGSVKAGAGTQALARAAKQAIAENSELAVYPTPDSEGFYLSLGGEYGKVAGFPNRIGFTGSALANLASKSADPVTRDDAGNVVPLSQRFNPADDRITFSLRPGDFASRVEAMFSPFQRSPEARLIMTRVAKSRALKLGQQVFEASIRTMGSIDREARVRAALAEDKAVQDYLDGLTPQARQTLEWQPADLQDDPLVSAMLDFGKLMSKTTALQRGKLDLKMGDFDGAPWLPPSFYSKGAGIMPDQMAQAMFDAGLLPDAYTDTLWSELAKRIEATRKDKAAHGEAVQAFKDAKKAARDAAAKEAGTWADNAKKQAGSGKAQRDRIKAWIKLHDAILAAIPAIIRHEVGSFAQVADYATDEAAMRFLESRVAKMDKVLEKYLVKQARGQLERIFDKARPKSDAGEKAKGKLTPELHAWFKLAEEAAKLSPAVADERIQGIEQSLASDMTDAIKQELSDWLGRPVTDDAEAQTWQETRLTLFQTFGAVMYGTDAKSERNAAEITAALDAAREAYQTGRLAHIEQLAKLREKRAEERGDGIQRVGSPYDPNKANTRKKALNEATGLKGRALDYMDTNLDGSGFFLDLLGDDTETDLYETTRRNLLEAAATKADNMEKRKADFAAMLKQVFPGKGLVDRLRGLWELQQIQENAPVGTMSQLQAMQFTLWHLDPDSREWLATNGYGDEWQAKAEQWLTAEAKAVRAWLLKQYDGQYDRLNPVFRRLRGVNLPRVEVYGGKRQIEHSKSDSTASIEADMMRGGMDAGFTKTRVSRPTGRPRMTDALQNYWQNALQVEHYIAFAETVTELKAVFGHRDFLGAVETNRGLAKKQQVLDWISNIETAGTRDAFAHSMQGKLFGRYGKAVSASALLFKLATLAKQAPAAIQSAFKVGLKEYFTSLSRILAGKGAISLGDMYRSDTVQRRLSGHDNEMLQASKGWNQRHFENEILDKAAIAPEVMMNAGWYAMGWTDARFTTISAAVAYDVAFRDGKKLGMTDDEAKAFAANQADLIVMETAQPQDVVTKSLAENMMPQALLRLVFAFQSANRQVFGLTYLAAKRGKVANAYAVAAIIAAMTQTIGGIMRMLFSDDDPEELFDPQAYALGMATAPLTGMVGLGPLVEFGLNFAGVESRFSPSSAAAAKSLQDIVNGEADTKDVGRVVSMAGAALGGRGAMLSVGWNVLNQIMGLYENVTANE